MKAILISIHPQWCSFIANGKLTIIARKTKPNIKTPFNCYVYCTKENIDKVPSNIWWKADSTGFKHIMNGKIIGEFICDEINESESIYNSGYVWHISNLKIYDKPKSLEEFRHTREYINRIRNSVSHWEYGIDDEITEKIHTPPKSWCYVEKEETK